MNSLTSAPIAAAAGTAVNSYAVMANTTIKPCIASTQA